MQLRLVVLLARLATVLGALYLYSNGTQEISTHGGPLLLPEDTRLGSSLSVLQELQALRAEVDALARNAKPGCAWDGLACQCHYTQRSTQMVLVLGSNCTNGVLQWVKVMDSVIATAIVGCSYFQMDYCDVFF